MDIERMENEIASNKQQIAQLESEKKNASADDKLTYTTQIQSLQTDIAKSEYDIKTKKIELEKLQNTINNATVKAEITGTVPVPENRGAAPVGRHGCADENYVGRRVPGEMHHQRAEHPVHLPG